MCINIYIYIYHMILLCEYIYIYIYALVCPKQGETIHKKPAHLARSLGVSEEYLLRAQGEDKL